MNIGVLVSPVETFALQKAGLDAESNPLTITPAQALAGRAGQVPRGHQAEAGASFRGGLKGLGLNLGLRQRSRN